MKKHITAIILALTLGVVHATAAQGFVAAPAVALSIESPALVAAPTPLLLAQVDTSGTTATTAPADAAAPWYLNGAMWLALITAALGIAAVWQNKEKRTADKINETLVLGIEAASRIPEVQAYEKKIKQQIQTQAQKAGVQPALDKIVQLLT